MEREKIELQIEIGCINVNTQFSKYDIQVANKHTKRCLVSLAIKEMQMKTIMLHFRPAKMALIKMTDKDMEK